MFKIRVHVKKQISFIKFKALQIMQLFNRVDGSLISGHSLPYADPTL